MFPSDWSQWQHSNLSDWKRKQVQETDHLHCSPGNQFCQTLLLYQKSAVWPEKKYATLNEFQRLFALVKVDISFEQGIFLGFFWNYFYPRILNWDFRIIPGISLDLSYFTWSSFLMLHEISAISAGLPGGICCLMLFAAEASLFSFLEAMMTLHPEF